MNVAMVRLFLEVVEAGSLSRVAARRQTVQSHISRQISDFEADFGGPLFRRTGRGVMPTELGRRAERRLRAWLDETERLTQELREASGQLLGEVRLGVIPSAAHPLMTRLFQHLQREHPGIRLNITEAQGTELNALLDAGAVDMAVLFRFDRPADDGGEKLLSVAHTYLIAAPGDTLTREPSVDFAKLAGLRLVLPRRPSHWRNALDEAARSLGFTLHSIVEVDSLTLQKELVAHTAGLYSIMGPYSIDDELHRGRLQVSQLVGPDLVRHVTLAFPRQGKLSPASRKVAETIERLTVSWGHRITEPIQKLKPHERIRLGASLLTDPGQPNNA